MPLKYLGNCRQVGVVATPTEKTQQADAAKRAIESLRFRLA
jgi:hypothetical protein